MADTAHTKQGTGGISLPVLFSPTYGCAIFSPTYGCAIFNKNMDVQSNIIRPVRDGMLKPAHDDPIEVVAPSRLNGSASSNISAMADTAHSKQGTGGISLPVLFSTKKSKRILGCVASVPLTLKPYQMSPTYGCTISNKNMDVQSNIIQPVRDGMLKPAHDTPIDVVAPSNQSNIANPIGVDANVLFKKPPSINTKTTDCMKLPVVNIKTYSKTDIQHIYGEKLYNCDVQSCGRRFVSYDDYTYHLKNHSHVHNNVIKNQSRTPRHVVESTTDNNLVHGRPHEGDNKFACKTSFCKKSFSLQKDLILHVHNDKTHELKMPRKNKIKCTVDLCKKTFSLHGDLALHLKAHEHKTPQDKLISRSKKKKKYAPQKCGLCGKQFRLQSDHRLNVHMMLYHADKQ